MREGWGHPDRISWTVEELSAAVGVSSRTINRWMKGVCPRYRNLKDAFERWHLEEWQRRALLDSREVSAGKVPASILSNVASFHQNRLVEVQRRHFLGASSAALFSPSLSLQSVEDSAARYNSIKALAESAGSKSYKWRVDCAQRIDNECFDVAYRFPTQTNHMLAAMAAVQYAFLLIWDSPTKAWEVARRSCAHANMGGRNLVRLWTATGCATIANSLNKPQEAINALEPVIELSPERGTMRVFAATKLAQAYGAIGHVEKIRNSLGVARRAREAISIGDEFSGTMAFPEEQEWIEGARALLAGGQYSEAIRLSSRGLDAYEAMPVQARRRGYMMRACLTISVASMRLGWWDAVEEYTHRGLTYIDRPPGLIFCKLLSELRSHRGHLSSNLQMVVEDTLKRPVPA